MPNSVSIFVLPSSKEELENRLFIWAQDSDDVIKDRMKQIQDHIEHCKEFDFLIINEDFTIALRDLCSIVLASRLKVERQLAKNLKLIDNLMV